MLDKLNLDNSIVIASDHATDSSKLKDNNKLLNVWYRSNNLDDLDKNCSQYFQLPKFFTSQECQKIPKSDNYIIDRGKNFPNYDKYNNLILGLIKKSQK